MSKAQRAPDSVGGRRWNRLLDWMAVALLRTPSREDMLDLMRLIVEGEREIDAERGPYFGKRIAEGECAVLGGHCLTHNETADAGHSYEHSGGTLD